MKKEYKKRLVDTKIKEYLEVFGAVCIEGAKWCGKTWTSMYHSNSKIMIGDPKNNFQNRQMAKLDPSLVLDGKPPRLIDEWQEVPEIWDAVRYAVDDQTEKGLYILTGSATPNHKGILHSGAGRIAKLKMRPMSLYESGDSSGMVSLSDVFQGKFKNTLTGTVDLKELIQLIVRGGWPANLETKREKASLLPAEYIKAIIDDDVFRIDGVKRDSYKMNLLLRSLARNESTTATNKTLQRDIKEIDDEDIYIETVAEYLDIIKRLFLTENQEPFSSNIRSSIRVKQAEKRHFVDPSIACAILHLNADALLKDLNTTVFLFEALCERDLRIYAETIGGNLFHYQDYADREIDAVIELKNGEWFAFEIKLGADKIDEAAENLLKIQKSLEKQKNAKMPKALCVVCGLSEAAYKRPDGVYVLPITALKP